MSTSPLLRLVAWPRRRSWLLLPLAYIAGLTLLSALPDPAAGLPAAPALGGLARTAFTIPPSIRNFLHLPLYFALGALTSWASSTLSLRDRRVAGLVFTLTAGYGAANEWLQGLTPGRSVSWGDLAVNLTGAGLGVFAAGRARRWATDRLTPEIRSPGLLTGFRLADGSAAAQWETAVQIDWDDRELRLRFDCEDDDAWGTHQERDAPLWQEEVVELFIAPGSDDPHEYFEIEMSPSGVLFDARVSNPTGRRADLRVDTSWDCPGICWRTGPGTSRQNWWAELALPWQSLVSSGTPPEIFRLNLFRVERPRGGRTEFSAWSAPWTHPADFHQPRCFGRLRRSGGRRASL